MPSSGQFANTVSSETSVRFQRTAAAAIPEAAGVHFLMQWVPSAFAHDAQASERRCGAVVWREHARVVQQPLKVGDTARAPPGAQRAVPRLRDDLRGDGEPSAGEMATVTCFERGAGAQGRREDSRVDAERRRAGGHSSSAATKRSHSSSVRSSIT